MVAPFFLVVEINRKIGAYLLARRASFCFHLTIPFAVATIHVSVLIRATTLSS